MAIPEDICTDSGFEAALGGPKGAAKLLDERKTATPFPLLVSTARRWGTTRVLMAYGVRQDVAALSPPYPPSLVQMAERFAAAEAWRLATGGVSVPPEIKESEKTTQQLCDLLVESKRTTAASPEPENQQYVVQVDPDPDGTGFTRKGLRGMW